jgi:hypothetical protein
VPISERKKEIRRRRKRRENYADMKEKLMKLPSSDTVGRGKIVEKLKKLSPGADDLIKAWGLK